MSASRADTPGLTIDELARAAKLPVRTIREYQTLRLLPPPTKQGRIGVYDEAHSERLALIARLQQRGYSLAGIRDLLESFEAGANLPALLGVDIGPSAPDEVPLRLTRDELATRLPGLTEAARRRALAVGLVHRDGAEHYLVRSPALLGLVADGAAAGVALPAMLDLVGVVREHLDALAETIADHLVRDVWEPLAATKRAAELEPFLRRGRVLLLQGVASMLADGLGRAIQERVPAATAAEELRIAIEHVRIGAVVDSDGNLEYRRPHDDREH